MSSELGGVFDGEEVSFAQASELQQAVHHLLGRLQIRGLLRQDGADEINTIVAEHIAAAFGALHRSYPPDWPEKLEIRRYLPPKPCVLSHCMDEYASDTHSERHDSISVQPHISEGKSSEDFATVECVQDEDDPRASTDTGRNVSNEDFNLNMGTKNSNESKTSTSTGNAFPTSSDELSGVQSTRPFVSLEPEEWLTGKFDTEVDNNNAEHMLLGREHIKNWAQDVAHEPTTAVEASNSDTSDESAIVAATSPEKQVVEDWNKWSDKPESPEKPPVICSTTDDIDLSKPRNFQRKGASKPKKAGFSSKREEHDSPVKLGGVHTFGNAKATTTKKSNATRSRKIVTGNSPICEFGWGEFKRFKRRTKQDVKDKPYESNPGSVFDLQNSSTDEVNMCFKNTDTSSHGKSELFTDETQGRKSSPDLFWEYAMNLEFKPQTIPSPTLGPVADSARFVQSDAGTRASSSKVGGLGIEHSDKPVDAMATSVYDFGWLDSKVHDDEAKVQPVTNSTVHQSQAPIFKEDDLISFSL